MAEARFKLHMHAADGSETVAKRDQAEKIRFLLQDIGFKYVDVPINEEDLQMMTSDGTLVTGTLPQLEDSKLDVTYEGSNSIMAAVSALAMKEQAFRGNNIYVGKDQVKTNALAEYATTLRQQVIDGAGTVSEDWIKLNFARLEAFLKSDDEEGYRVNWDNTDYGYITLFELINALVEKNSRSIIADWRILTEFHDGLAKTARFEKHITSRN